MVLQSGTTAIYPDGIIIGENDIIAQVDAIVDIAKGTMGEAVVALEDVVRTRIFVTDVNRAGRRDAGFRPAFSRYLGRRRRWSKSADWRARRS